MQASLQVLRQEQRIRIHSAVASGTQARMSLTATLFMDEGSGFWDVAHILDQEPLGLCVSEAVRLASDTVVPGTCSTGMQTCREDVRRDRPLAAADVEQVVVLAGIALAVAVVLDNILNNVVVVLNVILNARFLYTEVIAACLSS